jgi:radical SAM protein with 4Fe4S-binding SPASM domain
MWKGEQRVTQQTVLVRRRVPYRKMNGCSIIHLGARQIYLNELGTRIWEFINGVRNIEELVQEAAKFEGAILPTSPEAALLITEYLSGLYSKGLVAVAGDDSNSCQASFGKAGNSPAEQTPLETCQSAAARTAERGLGKTTKDRILQFYWEKRYIAKLHLELTYRCNLRCCHCYNSSHSGASRELTSEQWAGILAQAAELGCYFLVFTGGEPFARKDILDILQAACRLGFAFRISTNGSMIQEKHVDALQDMLPFLQGVDISIYGATSQTHDKVTSRPGSYAQTMAAIHSLREAQVPVVAKYVTMQMNFEGLDQFEEEMRAAAIPRAINTGSMSPRTDRNPVPLAQLLTDDQYRKMLAVRGQPKGGNINCILGWNYAAITSDGFMSPCEWLVDLKLGNLREASLREIWHGRGFQKFRESLIGAERECLRCDLRNFCCSCPARAYLETGSLFRCAPVQRHNAELCREFFCGIA